ncbi:hypothetical protein C900_03775 [Fulvivirga imtechensis AK7]|uniref:DUF4407 domain-containing protein n=1 Tax=Fulvivirga imtechensis AK7 TaxID=1237149 RepID=L8JN99_9BACT|nr:DUF4407 domain-containing protein [Fulvivirga imtechensis]ELR70421.1 hypothetical protein C900_03775 [Fulvivirga imtechensis AK7]
MEKLKIFFWRCSGANLTLLQKCPSDATKYVGIGATVLFTGIFAALAAGYALFTVVDNAWWAALFGIVWGLMIFNLDRYIVSSMRKEGRFMREFVMAIPRLLLAVLISLVIAKPLEMKIFEKEIKSELAIMEQETFSRQEQEVTARYAGRRQQLTNEIDALKTEIERKAANRDELRRIAQQEADGTGGTGKRNPGPVYKIKKENADKVEAELTELQQKNGALISQKLQEQATIDAQMQGELMAMEQERLDGPAARMEALDRLTAQSSAIFWANWFVILLFIAVETAPIFVKLISQRGPYDNLLKIEEHTFEVQRVEVMARVNADVKARSAKIPATEKDFIHERLDLNLYSS